MIQLIIFAYVELNCLETTEHFLLHCHIYASLHINLFANLRNKHFLVLPLNRSLIVQIFLYGSENYGLTVKSFIISCIIDFIIQSRHFDDPLFN